MAVFTKDSVSSHLKSLGGMARRPESGVDDYRHPALGYDYFNKVFCLGPC